MGQNIIDYITAVVLYDWVAKVEQLFDKASPLLDGFNDPKYPLHALCEVY